VTAAPTAYEAVHVVVPAHDEEALLPACLESVRRAAAALRGTRPHLHTRVTVVADHCSDDTVRVAARAGADVVEVVADCVGYARRAGVQRVVALSAGVHQQRVWIANTDADSVVPEHWLTRQLDLAAEGFAMVVGSVRPDERGLEPRLWRAWHDRGDDLGPAARSPAGRLRRLPQRAGRPGVDHLRPST